MGTLMDGTVMDALPIRLGSAWQFEKIAYTAFEEFIAEDWNTFKRSVETTFDYSNHKFTWRINSEGDLFLMSDYIVVGPMISDTDSYIILNDYYHAFRLEKLACRKEAESYLRSIAEILEPASDEDETVTLIEGYLVNKRKVSSDLSNEVPEPQTRIGFDVNPNPPPFLISHSRVDSKPSARLAGDPK